MGRKRIEDIRPDDKVWSVVDGKLQLNKVTWQGKTGNLPLYTIRTKNREIVSSYNHPFMVRDFDGKLSFKQAEQLKPGDYVVQPTKLCDSYDYQEPDGSAELCSIAGLDTTELGFYCVVSVEASGVSDVYDISVENAHNFIADGVVVHNSNYNLQERHSIRTPSGPR